MLNSLFMIEDRPASKIALEVACRLHPKIFVQPIFTARFAEHDLAIGAGWAWKTWERENRRKARKDVEYLVSVLRRKYKNLTTPIVVSGRPVKTVTHYFLDGKHDLIIAGTPFRGMQPLVLARRFQRAIRKTSKDLPLWIIKSSRPIKAITALTDGSDSAEKALGLLNSVAADLKPQITLIGLPGKAGRMPREALNLERGFAILREKGIDAQGYTAKNLTRTQFSRHLNQTDMLILSYSSQSCLNVFERFEPSPPSMVFFLDGGKA